MAKKPDIPVQGKNPKLEELEQQQVQPIKLVIGTPCYGGMVNEGYLQSMFSLTSELTSRGIPLMLITMANESLITRGRNEIVNMFMRGDATHLMFIDADITFKTDDVLNMLAANKDVVAGAYPLKMINWDGVAHMQEKMNGEASVEQFRKAAIHTVINVSRPSTELVGKSETVQVANGLVEVFDAGTGFMMIRRNVLEKMCESFPETKYYQDKDMTLPLKERERYALFDTMIDDDGRYLSEDYTFCRRWQKLGGKVHVDVRVLLDHTGTYTFKGSPILNTVQ